MEGDLREELGTVARALVEPFRRGPVHPVTIGLRDRAVRNLTDQRVVETELARPEERARGLFLHEPARTQDAERRRYAGGLAVGARHGPHRRVPEDVADH